MSIWVKCCFGVMMLGSLLSCNVLPGTQGGACKTADGFTVNTYSIFGTWKQITGYDPARSKTTLEQDYDVLAVMRSGATCKLEVINGADSGTLSTVMTGIFSHVVDLKQLSINFTNDVRTSRSGVTDITYAFRGTCENTQMVWTFDDGTTELYQYRSKSTENVSCASEAQ